MKYYNNSDYDGEKISEVSKFLHHPLYHTFPEQLHFFNPENEYAYFLGARRMQFQNLQENFYKNYGSREKISGLSPYQIADGEQITLYLAQGVAYEEAFIDPSIFCVLNVSDHLNDEAKQTFRTLVFYEDGLIVKTMESSNHIMERIFQRNGIRYEQIRFIIKSIEGKPHHSSPYVLGNASFLPLKGPIKKDVTWVSLGHLTDFNKITGSNTHIRLDFKNRHTFDAEISIEAFQRHIDTAEFIYSCQYNFLSKASHFFDMNILYQGSSGFQSLLSKNHQINHHKKLHSFEEVLILMMLSLWREISKEDPFKENPLVEEINEFLARQYPAYV